MTHNAFIRPQSIIANVGFEPRTQTWTPPPLVQSGLAATPLWSKFKERYVLATGRVVDPGNDDVSHSESQGYGMLFAVAANDRESFDRIWNWTRDNLMVRGDHLFAWRWRSNRADPVDDPNNASDGDLAIAWALVEAGQAWNSDAYRQVAERIVIEFWAKIVVMGPDGGLILRPGEKGYGSQDAGFVVNPSYWIFPALQRLAATFPGYDWSGVVQGGLHVLRKSRSASATGVAGDWMRLADGKIDLPSDGGVFGYDAIRIPIYLAWSQIDDTLLRDYLPAIKSRALLNLSSGARRQGFGGREYESVLQLMNCIINFTPYDMSIALKEDGRYYPDALRILSFLAFQSVKTRCGAATN